jgi:hypothetical protein
VFLVLAHERRRIVHFAVTAHPTAEWTPSNCGKPFRGAARPGIYCAIGIESLGWLNAPSAITTQLPCVVISSLSGKESPAFQGDSLSANQPSKEPISRDDLRPRVLMIAEGDWP